MMIRRTSTITFFWLAVSVMVHGQQAKEDIMRNVCLSAGSLADYPLAFIQDTLTPPPAGKKPFYMSHYGRHGSRHLIEPTSYTDPLKTLREAEMAGVLSDFGRIIWERLVKMDEEATDRYGELTQVGVSQMRGIANRMVKNFPELFTDTSYIDARSSIYIRCILSMENVLQELYAHQPKMKIHHDAAVKDMSFILPGYQASNAKERGETREARNVVLPTINGTRVASQFFTDMNYAKSVGMATFAWNLFELVSQLQNTPLRDSISLYEIFNDDELYDIWHRKNTGAYNNNHKGGMTGILLGRMLDDANKAIAEGGVSAHLRFGHESVLLPLVCRMGINNYDHEYDTVEQLDSALWHTYRIYPMASNLQVIFYRSNPDDDDILVKVLLNEREVSLPISTDTPPYYRWEDVKDYWSSKR